MHFQKNEWTDRDRDEFAKLVANDLTKYTTINDLTTAFNAIAETKRSPGAVNFRLRAYVVAGALRGDRRDHAECMITLFRNEKRVRERAATPKVEPVLSRNWLPATDIVQRTGYSRAWVELMGKQGRLRRMRSTFRAMNGKTINGWVYSEDDLNQYLNGVRRVGSKPEVATMRAATPRPVASHEAVAAPSHPAPITKLVTLVKSGRIDLDTFVALVDK